MQTPVRSRTGILRILLPPEVQEATMKTRSAWAFVLLRGPAPSSKRPGVGLGTAPIPGSRWIKPLDPCLPHGDGDWILGSWFCLALDVAVAGTVSRKRAHARFAFQDNKQNRFKVDKFFKSTERAFLLNYLIYQKYIHTHTPTHC